MDENKNQLGPNPLSSNLGGQNRPAAPPPPPPEISIRTMKSDVESLRQTGGTGPTPKPFIPPELARETPRPTAPPPPPPRITPSDFTAPKPIAESPASKLKNIVEEEPPKKSGGKKLVMVIGGLIFAAVIAIAGYLYVFPLLFPAQPPAPPITVNQPTQTAAETPALTTPALTHKSLLQLTSPVSTMQLPAFDLKTFKTVLSEEAQKPLAVDSLTEIVVQDASGQVPASTLIPAIIPDLSPIAIANIFEEDYTIALYQDSNGVWPVYLLKLNAEASPVEAQTEISKLESSSNIANLFLSDPGMPSAAGFKSGQAAGLPTRYLTYSQKGAGLNIAWSKDTLILSASYNGLKKVASSLAE